MAKVPTLLIGLGGLGSQVVSMVSSMLPESEKHLVAVHCLDTDIESLNKLKNVSFTQTSDSMTVEAYLSRNPEAAEWYPINPYLNPHSLDKGAAQVRANSRLAFEAAVAAGKLDWIEQTIDSLSQVNGESTSANVRIMIVCSIAGGTGAGLFLQLPLYIKSILEKSHREGVLIRGFFLGADIVAPEQNDPFKEKSVYTNAYACIKELNTLFSSQEKQIDESNLKLTFYTPKYTTLRGALDNTAEKTVGANMIPYDCVFLLERLTKHNLNIGSLDKYLVMAADIVKFQLFSPISGNMVTLEDNALRKVTETNGRSRFASAAIARAIYPYEDVLDYCSLCCTLENVKNFWQHIDISFTEEYNSKLQERRLNPTITLPQRSTHYITTYETLMNTPESPFAPLAADVVKRAKQADGTPMLVYVDKTFIRSVKDHVAKYLASNCPEIQAAKKKCTVSQKQFDSENVSAAASEINRVITALREYKKTSEDVIENIYNAVAESIIPANPEISGTLQSHCIYSLLRTVHPLSARYLLYSIRKGIEEFYRDHENSAHSADLDVIAGYDFDDDKDGRQSPTEALPNMTFFLTRLVNRRDFNYVTETFCSKASEQTRKTSSYCESLFAYKVFKVVLDRLDDLIKVYEMFFDSIPNITAKQQVRKDLLHAKYDHDADPSTEYILCSSAHMDTLYKSLESSLHIAPGELNEEATASLAGRLYRAFIRRLKSRADLSSSNAKKLDTQTSVQMNKVFTDGIFNVIKRQIADLGAPIIDKDIFTAIKEQISLSLPESEQFDEDGNPVKISDNDPRVRDIYKRVASRAVPFVHLTSSTVRSERFDCGVCADLLPKNNLVGDRVDSSQLTDILRNVEGMSNVTVQPETFFDKHELVLYHCYQELTPDDLTNYQPGSIAHTCYMERINAVETQRLTSTGNINKERIHPHLDKRWHHEGYLMPLCTCEQEKYDTNRIRALFMALAHNLCWVSRVDMENTWIYANFGITKQITIDNARIAATYYDLYNSFRYNRIIMESIINYNEDYLNTLYGRLRRQISFDLLDEPLIKALCGKSFIDNSCACAQDEHDPFSPPADNEFAAENAMDVIYSVAVQSGLTDFTCNTMLTELRSCISAICNRVYGNGMTNTARTAYSRIMNEMYNCSAVSTLTDDQINPVLKKAFAVAANDFIPPTEN